MSDQRRRRTGFAGWWARYAGSVAFVLLVALASLGFWQIEETIDQIEGERTARAGAVSGIINLFCTVNNDQDQTLAALVQVSLGESGERDFGESLDPTTLSSFDVRVLDTIAKVQSADQGAGLTQVFERELAELKDTIPCEELVESFQRGEDIEDLSAKP